MKKYPLYLKLLITFTIILTFSSLVYGNIPRRSSTRVNDVFLAYSADGWIVSPNEEEYQDQLVVNAPECDINSVISCYDKDNLRIDITLHSPITYNIEVAYGLILGYQYVEEYYIYYPYTDEFIYCTTLNEEIIEYESLKNNNYDYAGVTSFDNKQNRSIYIIINKEKHFDGIKGNLYYLNCSFYSGYIDLHNNFQIADETIEVEIEYEL